MAKKRRFSKRLVILPIAGLSLMTLQPLAAESTSPFKASQSSRSQEGFTVNFNNVNALELLKFISKVGNTNFIYEPQDLQFNITFISEEPTSLESLLTAFSQILNIHNLLLIEEGNNLVIHRNPQVKSIAPLLTANSSLKGVEGQYLVTRVFNIQNANPANIESILKPMLSASAIITTLADTRQLILVDLSTNVERAADLIHVLDTPASNLEMKTYRLKNGGVENIAQILRQIILPLSEGNPVILVPQSDTNTLYMVSTSFLIKKSMEILLQLDQMVKNEDKNLTLDNILIYKLRNKSYATIQKNLNEILQTAASQGYQAGGLVQVIKSAEFLQATNSILFIGDKTSLDKVRAFLNVIDDAERFETASENNKFYIYEPKGKRAEEIFKYLKEIERHLVGSHLGDPNLINCLESMQVVKSTNSLIFIGDPRSLDEVNQLIRTFDIAEAASKNEFFIYTPLHLSPQTLMDLIKQLSKKLSSGVENPALIKAIDTAQYIPSSYSIVFTGSSDTLAKIKNLMESIDTQTRKDQIDDQMLIYKLKVLTKKAADAALENFAMTLPIDSPIHDAIEGRSYLPQSNSYVFKGNQEAIERIKQVMELTDTITNSKDQILMYRIKSDDEALLLEHLKTYIEELSSQDRSYETLKTFRYIPNSRMIIFKGTQEVLSDVEKLMALLDSKTDDVKLISFNYKVQSAQMKPVVDNLRKVQDKLSKSDPLYTVLKNAQVVENSRLILFKGTAQQISELQTLLAQVDIASVDLQTDQMLYPLKVADGQTVLDQLKALENRLKKDPSKVDHALIDAISGVEWIRESNTLVITGTKRAVDQTAGFIASFDVAKNKLIGQEVLNYQVKNVHKDKFYQLYNDYVANLKSTDPYAQVFLSAQQIPGSQLIIFRGSADAIIQVKDILGKIDAAASGQEVLTKESSRFIIYKPQSLPAKELKKQLEKYGQDLADSQFADPLLINSLKGTKLTEGGEALMITGNEPSIAKIKELIQTVDRPQSASTSSTLFAYKTKTLSAKQLKKELLELVKGLSGQKMTSDPFLILAIENAQVVENSQTVLFSGNDETLAKLKLLIDSIDSGISTADTKKEADGFFVYKPRFLDAKQIKRNIDGIIDEFENTGLTDTLLIRTLKASRLTDNNRSILFTGTPDTIKKVQSLLETLDVGSDVHAGSPNFFLYKAVNLPASDVREMLLEIATDLEKSGLSDTRLIQTIRQSTIAASKTAITFTGDDATLKKVQELLPSVDIAKKEDISGIQQIGQTTFMIYKIQQASPELLMESLRAIAKDLGKARGADQDLIKTIDNMRYVDETRSIVFTGSHQTLSKVTTLLEKFDLPAARKVETTRASAEDYVLYQPKFLSGDELIMLMKDFETSLRSTGVKDHQLIDCIQNLKWMPKTTTIIVSGDKQSIAKVMGLLEKFDVPGKQEKKAEPMIETIEDTSFLIYKVQYHAGASILEAVSRIGGDLSQNMSAPTQALVKAIRTLQVVNVTNSLVATGDAKSLSKLKELIQNIDVPLKQIFIEVLVVETDLINDFSLGLRWASQGKIKNKLAFSAANSGKTDTQAGIPVPIVKNVNATTPPNPANIPVTGGGSLGVIGDLIFHKGQSFVSLGDFVNALQTDTDSTIVLNQKLITQDNRDSSLFVGQNIPYTGSQVTNQSSNTTTQANILYMDIGIQLEITPKVGDDNIITMDIKQNITEEKASSQTSSTGTNVFGIPTRKTTLTTSVHVPNDYFVVLTGQIRNQSTRTKVAIPCLGGLPLIGAAFTENASKKNNSSIVMFIKPHIINTEEEYKKLTERQEDLFRNESVDEDFDKGVELVKTPDDK